MYRCIQSQGKGELLHRLRKDAARLQVIVQQVNQATLKIQNQTIKRIYLLFQSIVLDTNLKDLLVTECNGHRHFVNVLQGAIKLHLKHTLLLLRHSNMLALRAATLLLRLSWRSDLTAALNDGWQTRNRSRCRGCGPNATLLVNKEVHAIK